MSATSAGEDFTVDQTAPVVSVSRVADTSNGLFDGGFTVTESATVTITIDGTALTGSALTDAFAVTGTSTGTLTYTAQTGEFAGTEVVVVSATRER